MEGSETDGEKVVLYIGDGSQQRRRVLVCASGSVDAVKLGDLCRQLCEWGEVAAVATENALSFIKKFSLPTSVPLYTDKDDWNSWKIMGDGVLHVQLSRWADIIVIAPLSANTLAKISGGLCDNLLTCVVRAWDYSKPIFIAPSMHPFMWTNSSTEKHMMILDDMGINLIPPVPEMVDGEEGGTGAMADTSHINMTVRMCCGPPLD